MKTEFMEAYKSNPGSIVIERVSQNEFVWTHVGGSIVGVCCEMVQFVESQRKDGLCPIEMNPIGVDEHGGVIMYRVRHSEGED